MMNITRKDLRKEFHEKILRKIVFKDPLTKQERLTRNEWLKEFEVDFDLFKFYSDKRILFEIVKYLENRELCFDAKIRWLLASKIDSLLYHFYFYQIFENPKSFYRGLTSLKTREKPPHSPGEKTRWQDNYWTSAKNPAFYEHISGYDMVLDIDAKDWKESYKDAKKIFDYFNKFKIKFTIQFSGKKGFHFSIPFEEFKDLIKPFSPDNCVLFSKAIYLDLKDKLKLKKIDPVIYSLTRYIKIPYSLDARNNKVILPLSNKEFLDFPKNFNTYTSIKYVLDKNDLGFRGVYSDRQSNPKQLKKMLEDL